MSAITRVSGQLRAFLTSVYSPESFSGHLLKLGVRRAIVLVTVSSMVLSLAITALIMRLFGVVESHFWFAAMITATAAPLIIATILAIVLVPVLHHLSESRELVRKLALTDELTGLYNRHHFRERAEAEFQASIRQGHPLSVVLLDVDHFKSINDTYGHSVGDLALRTIANACNGAIRISDVLGRYGGEEFVALLPLTDSEAAITVAERIRGAVETRPVELPEKSSLRVTMSLGVATLVASTGSVDELLSRADRALYHAKNSGRNRVGVDRGGVLDIAEMEFEQYAVP